MLSDAYICIYIYIEGIYTSKQWNSSPFEDERDKRKTYTFSFECHSLIDVGRRYRRGRVRQCPSTDVVAFIYNQRGASTSKFAFSTHHQCCRRVFSKDPTLVFPRRSTDPLLLHWPHCSSACPHGVEMPAWRTVDSSSAGLVVSSSVDYPFASFSS